MSQFDRKDYLKTRHFIVFDQINTQKKIALLKEKSASLWWKKLKTFLNRLFKLHQEN